MQFEIPVREERGRKNYIITLHLIVCFLLLVTGIFEFLVYIFFSKSGSQYFAYFPLFKWSGIITFLAGIALLSLILFRNKWLAKPGVNKAMRSFEFALFTVFTIVAWKHQVIYPAVIFGVTALVLLFGFFWENRHETRKVIMDEKGIWLPKAGNRFLKWHEVERIILKFGIITIDCVDNRLLQWNVETVNFDDEIFQEFCHAQIAAHLSQRNKNW